MAGVLMKKLWLLMLLLIPPQIFCQHDDVGVFAVGNFNPTSYVYIQNTPHTVISSNKSSFGGGAEYRHY